MNAISQINRTTSYEKIAQIVNEEVGCNLIDDLYARGYRTYEELATCLVSYERDICRAAQERVKFLIGNETKQSGAVR